MVLFLWNMKVRLPPCEGHRVIIELHKHLVLVEKEEQIMVGESDSIFHIQRVLGEYELTDL